MEVVNLLFFFCLQIQTNNYEKGFSSDYNYTIILPDKTIQ